MSDLLDKLATETIHNIILYDAVETSTRLLDDGFFDQEAKTAKLMATKAIDIICEQHSVAVSPEVRAAMVKLWMTAIIAHHKVTEAAQGHDGFDLSDLSELLNDTSN